MDRAEFQRLLTRRFYPDLRAEGFGGSGVTLRRVNGPVVHVFNVLGDNWSKEFQINLGAHLTLLPTEGGGTCDPGTIKEYHCAFRTRVDPPTRPDYLRWSFGQSLDAAEAAITQLKAEWLLQGQPFFDKYSNYPDGFAALVREAVKKPPDPGDGLRIARVAVALGMRDEAAAVARRALAMTSKQAAVLREWLEELLRGLGI